MFVQEKKYRRFTAVLCVLGIILMLSHLALHSRFPLKYNDIIIEASQRHGVAPSLVHAVIFAESGFNASAVSSAGAMGLMQLMPRTAAFAAEQLGIEFKEEKLFDPAFNINLGVFYLARLLRRFPTQRDAIAAYNAGEGNVSNWLARDLNRIPFPETRRYVARVTRAQWVYRTFRGVAE